MRRSPPEGAPGANDQTPTDRAADSSGSTTRDVSTTISTLRSHLADALARAQATSRAVEEARALSVPLQIQSFTPVTALVADPQAPPPEDELAQSTSSLITEAGRSMDAISARMRRLETYMTQLTESVGALDRMRAQTAAHERMMVGEQNRGELRTRVDDAVGRAYDRMRNAQREPPGSPVVASPVSAVESSQSRLQSAVDNLRNRVNELHSTRAAFRYGMPEYNGPAADLDADQGMTSRGRRVMIRSMLGAASDTPRQGASEITDAQRPPTWFENGATTAGIESHSSATPVDLRHLFQTSVDMARGYAAYVGPTPLQPVSPSEEGLPSLEVVPPTWGPDWGTPLRLPDSQPPPGLDTPQGHPFLPRHRPLTRINRRILDGMSQTSARTSDSPDPSASLEWPVWSSIAGNPVPASWPPVDESNQPSVSRRRLDAAGRSVGVSRESSNTNSADADRPRRALSSSSSEAATELAFPTATYSPPFSPYVPPESVYPSIPAPTARSRPRPVREDANGDETISDDDIASLRRREEIRRRSRLTSQSTTYLPATISTVNWPAEGDDADKASSGAFNTHNQQAAARSRFETSRRLYSSTEPFKPHPLPIPEWIHTPPPGALYQPRSRNSPPPPLHGSVGRARAALHAKGSRRLGRRIEHVVGR